MLTVKYFLYSFSLGIISLGIIGSQETFARHHHKDGPPPPVTKPKKNNHLNPQQSTDDISPFARQAAENARQQQANIKPQNTDKKQDGPTALLPGHYTKRSQNGAAGWVNGPRRRGKYDMGLNMPVPQTADPTQNKTRGVFRRSMPVYEPNY